MHRCLAVLDLILLIARQIKANGSWKSADLLAFILTCRTICYPALDILWEELEDPHPLIYLFPEISVMKEDQGLLFPDAPPRADSDEWKKRKIIIYMTDIPGPNDWDRFIFYSRKIRTLHCYSGFGLEYIYNLLPHSPPGIPLLPNLKHLIWTIPDLENWSLVFLFISSTLIRVDVTIPTAYDALRFMDILCDNVPKIQVINFDYPKNLLPLLISQEMQLKLNGMVTSLHRVTHLQLTTVPAGITISISALRVLSLFEHLQHLKIEITEEPYASSTSYLFPHSAFQCLEELELWWRDSNLSGLVSRVIKAMKAPQLSRLCVQSFCYVHPTDVTALIAAISTHSTLTELEIANLGQCNNPDDPAEEDEDEDEDDEDDDDELRILPLNHHRITPLFFLTKLQSFKLLGYTLSFSKDTIDTLTQSWRKLRTIIIDDLHEPNPLFLVDFSDYHCFFIRCPDLSFIKIPFYCNYRYRRHLPPSHGNEEEGMSVVIDLAGCKVDNPLLTSIGLIIIFGTLVTVKEQDNQYISHNLRMLRNHLALHGFFAWEYINIEEWAMHEPAPIDIL
ncbi:hypothetical protein QCA50_020908 [Cerrena zonata]|uniref:F-box domain-containing protein n=1 Tax=Cerrena zonata TaxID=2478898 RepID=A0AAW0F8G1_9APHY